jgi:hypothetical protein
MTVTVASGGTRPGRLSAGVPAGGAGLRVEDYLAFLGEEYLADFVRSGGAAVKVAVPGDADVAGRFRDGLAQTAGREGFLLAEVRAEDVRLHMMDQLFFAVSGQLYWDGLAADAVRTAYDQVAFPAREGDLTVEAVARDHRVDSRELYRSVRRQLERAVLRDERLTHEFSLAMLRLCQAHLGPRDVADAERRAVLDWLRGEKVPLSALRSSLIYARIARHNARAMFASTTHWLARSRSGGLLLELDLSRLAESHRPPAAERVGVYYTKATAMDAYEVIRQLIDHTDDLESTMVVVIAPPALITDETRGVPAYDALQLWIADEVRDRRRANPFAALIRLDARLEVVG